MDEFTLAVMTQAVNMIQAPTMQVYDLLYRPKEHGVPSEEIKFDINSGSRRILSAISVFDPATVTMKTGRKTITVEAPRLATKRHIAAGELVKARAFGEQFKLMSMKNAIAHEQQDMKFEHLRTMEYWACKSIMGKILDADGSTLVDYNLPADHNVTLVGTELWTDAASKPLENIETWQDTIGEDSGATITGWLAIAGKNAYKALLKNENVLKLLDPKSKDKIAKKGDVEELANTQLVKYVGSFEDDEGNKQEFIPADYFILLGLCDDLTDCPYAAVVDDEAPAGIGNVDIGSKNMVMFFSKQWPTKDPSGRWIKVECRPLPILRRPGAVVVAKVV